MRAILGILFGVTCAQAQIAVTTAQYDNARTNANLSESVLNTANVNQKTFGKLYSRPLDGYSYALPLYLPKVNIPAQGLHNVVYVATMHNTVYAFDADDPAASTPLWKTTLGTALVTVSPVWPYIQPEIGILSTPVIDLSTGTLFAVAVTGPDQSHVSLALHALDIATGVEKFNGPVTIQAQLPNATGTVTYDPNTIAQRTALLLQNNAVYLAFAAASAAVPWHGWVLGYNATNLQQQTAVFNVTLNGRLGGIWQSGRGLAADSAGQIYLMDSDGDYDGITNFSNAFLKLVPPKLTVGDWFTPSDYAHLTADDLDLGSSGPIVLPNATLVVGGGKDGVLYVLNRGKMGHLQSASSQPVQSFVATTGCGSSTCAEIHSLAFWNTTKNPALFLWGWNDKLRGYEMNKGKFKTTPFAQSAMTSAYPGGGITVSSHGSTAGTGIVWASTSTDNTYTFIGHDTVRAFNALTLTELWNSDQNAARDGAGNIAKFAQPVVANGKVFVPTFSNQLVVYGLLPVAGK